MGLFNFRLIENKMKLKIQSLSLFSHFSSAREPQVVSATILAQILSIIIGAEGSVEGHWVSVHGMVGNHLGSGS